MQCFEMSTISNSVNKYLPIYLKMFWCILQLITSIYSMSKAVQAEHNSNSAA